MSKFTKPYHGMLPTIREIPPPIFFMTRLKKVEAEGADSDKVEPESIRYEFLLDPFFLKNSQHNKPRMKSLRFWIRPNLPIGMKP
jgi:hypothetical protein